MDTPIALLTTKAALADFCQRASKAPYVTVDTEFLRERTYYAKLCLVQLAYPGSDADSAILIDPLAPDMDLAPLYELFANPSVCKVFHAARQDLEIIFLETGQFPTPIFDTQVAAMVCGFGDQVGYETLVRQVTGKTLDKSSRLTDWSRRPLSEAQKSYALADVTHLRDIYEQLSGDLDSKNRREWVVEELDALTDPAVYATKPEDAWKRIKTRSNSGRFLACVKELAATREIIAQKQNLPRNHVIKDEALLELASNRPNTHDDLERCRLLTRSARKSDVANALLKAIATAGGYTPEELPRYDRKNDNLKVNPAMADLLRVLMKAKSEENRVAPKLLASASELNELAAGVRDTPALRGWRYEVFGKDALRLCKGEVSLGLQGEKIVIIEQ